MLPGQLLGPSTVLNRIERCFAALVSLVVFTGFGGERRPEAPSICSLDRSHIPFGETIEVRALLALAGGGYGQVLTNRECLKKLGFRVDGSLPPELADQAERAFRESVRQGRPIVVEADMTVGLRKIDLFSDKAEHPMAGAVKIFSAKKFRLQPINYGDGRPE